MPTAKSLTFSIWIEDEDGVFVAYGLETGLVATSRDMDDVVMKVCKLHVRQISFAIKNGRMDDIYHPAPQEIWDKFRKTEERVIVQTRKSLTECKPGLMIAQTAYASAC